MAAAVQGTEFQQFAGAAAGAAELLLLVLVAPLLVAVLRHKTQQGADGVEVNRATDRTQVATHDLGNRGCRIATRSTSKQIGSS